MIPTKDHYSILECERFSDRETVRKNFYRLMLAHHPDKAEDHSPFAQAMVEAWSILGDEEKKKEYDSKLKQASQNQELLNYKFGWQVSSMENKVQCPQCGEPSQIERGQKRVECDSCSAIIEVHFAN